MATIWTPKDPSEIQRYVWEPALFEWETLTGKSFTVLSGAATATSEIVNSTVEVFVTGGVAGTQCAFTGTATTSEGRVLEETFYVPIISSAFASADTARDVVAWAMRKLSIISPSAEPTADELETGLDALNGMLGEWRIDGMDLGLPELDAGSIVTTESTFLRAIRYSLAEDIASDFGLPVPQNVAIRAEQGRDRVRAALFQIGDLKLDRGYPRWWLANEYYA